MHKINVRLDEVLYYLFLLFTMGAKGIGLTDGQRLFGICIFLAYSCIGLKLLITEYSLKEWCINIALLLLTVLITKNSGEKAAIAAVLIIIGMKNIPVKRALRVALNIWGITFIFSAFRGVLGFSEGVVVVHEKLGLGPIIRYSLGYTHPNVLHVTYFVIVMMLLYVIPIKGKKLWITAILLFIGNLYVFLYSISYTGLIIVTAFLCLTLYFNVRKEVTYLEKVLLEVFVLFCIIFPIVGPLIIKGRLFNFFNKLLSTRFQLVYYFFHNFKLSLFGTKTQTPSDAHLTLDSSFAYLLMYYGIIAFVLMVIVYMKVLHKYLKEDKRNETIIMVCTALAGITEQFLFNLSFKNITFFFIGDYLYNNSFEKDNNVIYNRKFRVISLKYFDKVYCISTEMFFQMKKIMQQIQWKRCVFKSLPIAILTFLLFTLIWNPPERVYVNRGLTEYEGEFFIPMENEKWMKDNSLSIGSMQPGEKIYEFYGNITRLEYVRRAVSAILFGLVFGIFINGSYELKEMETKRGRK